LEKRIVNNDVIYGCTDFIIENNTEEIAENNFDESEYNICNIRYYLADLPEDEIYNIGIRTTAKMLTYQ
jgi:hypothetical protein